jgi:hypothetical protein
MLIPSIDGSGVHDHIPTAGYLSDNSALRRGEEFSDPFSGGLMKILQAINGVML